MKKLFLAMSAALMLASCENYSADEIAGTSEKLVTFTLSNGEAVTRATLEEMNITDLWLFDYVGEELKNAVHKTDEFDAVTLPMSYGEHTVCIVASRGAEPTVTAPVISWTKPSDTFWATLTIDVQPGTSGTHSVVLKRVATRLRISITDQIPASAATLEVEPATWYYGINVRTGEGCEAKTQPRQVTIPSSYVGTEGKLTASFFGLSPKDEWKTDITVRLLAGDNTKLGEVLLPDAAFQMNSTTIYSGGILSTISPFSVTVDDVWGEDRENTW